MPSPFPGMDPYLEVHWREIHARLVIYACDVLQGGLPRGLRARVEENVLLETPIGFAPHPRIPDIRVVEFAQEPQRILESDEGFVATEPVLVALAVEEVTEPSISIIDQSSGNRVVTVIEFLSPSNKSPGRNRQQYLKKQEEICSSDTNLVEIDLNRFGTHTLAFPLAFISRKLRTPYMACVRRAGVTDHAEVYPMPIWNRLPNVKIPLRPTDDDVPLDLQQLIDQCYRNGAYEGTLDYSKDPDPPLRGADKEWAEKYLTDKGLRPKNGTPRHKGKPKKNSG